MVNKKMKVKKGGSTKVFNIKLDGVTDYTDYFGDLDVLDANTKVSTGVTRTVAPDPANGFDISLTPAETSTLDVDSYIVVFEITKDPIGNGLLADFTYRRELTWQLEVQESLINN
jgi:hypothetical protein